MASILAFHVPTCVLQVTEDGFATISAVLYTHVAVLASAPTRTVLNHMVGAGNDANPKHEDTNCNKWGNKSSSGAADWHNGASSSVEGAPSLRKATYTRFPT